MAKHWALKNLRGTYTNAETGWDINIRRDGVKEMSGKTPSESGMLAKLNALPAIPDLIRHAILGDSHADRYGRKAILAVHNLYAPLRIKGRMYRVKMRVFELVNGRKLYNHGVAVMVSKPSGGGCLMTTQMPGHERANLRLHLTLNKHRNIGGR